jgi:hypothetical protein
MKIIQGDRGLGKTTALIEWLLEGHKILGYPGWSRVIICPNHAQTTHATAKLREATKVWSEDSPETWDMRKCVWDLSDLRSGLRGTRRDEVELGFDNFDMYLDILGLPRLAVVTMSEPVEVEHLANPVVGPRRDDRPVLHRPSKSGPKASRRTAKD